MPSPQFSIEWDAYEYEHKKRSSDWFLAMTIFTLAVSVTSIILGNIIFAILILISAFALSLFINREPDIIHVKITETGITRGKVHYPYATLSSFWIDTDHPHKKIILRSNKLLMPFILVPLADDTDTARVERTLARFIEQEFHTLPFVEKLLEYLGF